MPRAFRAEGATIIIVTVLNLDARARFAWVGLEMTSPSSLFDSGANLALQEPHFLSYNFVLLGLPTLGSSEASSSAKTCNTKPACWNTRGSSRHVSAALFAQLFVLASAFCGRQHRVLITLPGAHLSSTMRHPMRSSESAILNQAQRAISPLHPCIYERNTMSH